MRIQIPVFAKTMGRSISTRLMSWLNLLTVRPGLIDENSDIGAFSIVRVRMECSPPPAACTMPSSMKQQATNSVRHAPTPRIAYIESQ